jgi:hypothetical protein
MSRLRVEFVIAGLCAILLGLLGYERGKVEQERRPSTFSTYDTGPNGYRALYEVLRAAGVPVRRFEDRLPALDSQTRTLVITSYEYEGETAAKPLDANDADSLRSFVRAGGRLVAIDSQFAGSADAAPAVGTTVRSSGGAAVPIALNGYTHGVARVSGPIEWSFPFSEPGGVPLLANNGGMVAVWYRCGRGEVIAITAPGLFSNEALRDADNLRFAYNVIAGRGAVAFDEYVHGYSEEPTTWSVLPGPVHAAIWIVIAIALVALVGANVPFAPPYLPDLPDERTSSDYISAIAELMRRSRRRAPDDDLLWNAQIDFQRRKEHHA